LALRITGIWQGIKRSVEVNNRHVLHFRAENSTPVSRSARSVNPIFFIDVESNQGFVSYSEIMAIGPT
jgi:hypothetical protein